MGMNDSPIRTVAWRCYRLDLYRTGWWSTWSDGFGGYLKADTLAGLKQLVREYE
jgi:hypothetical protein